LKIKIDNIEFQSFNDGICDIYSLDNDDTPVYKHEKLGFNKRILGYNRVFAAKASQVQVNAVIRIPNLKDVEIHDIIVIYGMGKYDIQLIQDVLDSNPLSRDLTLKQLEMFTVIV